MEHRSMKRTWRLALVAVLALGVVVTLCLPPAAAGTATPSVGPERAVGGVTVAERIARQQRLHAEIAPKVPAGITNAPVYVDISDRDRADLAAPIVQGEEPLKVGVVKQVPVPAGKPAGQDFVGGALDEKPDGTFVWAVSVISPGAQAIRLHLTDVSLPQGAEMYLLGADGQADGPYTGRGRNGDGDFWTRSIVSESGTLVVRYTGSTPNADRPKIAFVVSEVGHIRGRPPRPVEQNHDSWPCADNVSCIVDATCGSTGPAAPAEAAVAKMEWIQGPYIYTCTGGLIADTDNSSQIPYFLTANHCLSSNNSNLETFFFYTTSSCNGACPDSLVTGGTPPPADTVGVSVVATGRAGDFTLLTLNETPPAGVTYLGWTSAPVASSNGTHLYRISNPNFGPQAYSAHDVDTSKPTCQGWPRGERIYSEDITGATMGGSSGSPVVNSSSQIVGQLSGCCGFNCGDECDSGSNATVDGAFAYYFNQVAPYLNPPGCTPTTEICTDGLDNDCDGATDCADSNCSTDPACAGCSTNADCDDGLFCNGGETCSAGTCLPGSNPCSGGQTCDEANNQCVSPTCGGNRATCSTNADCCSGNCKRGTCKGN